MSNTTSQPIHTSITIESGDSTNDSLVAQHQQSESTVMETPVMQPQFNDASYFQYQQGLFYELLADCLVKWVADVKQASAKSQSETNSETSVNSDTSHVTQIKQIRSFIDTWTYALYTRGIKRRRITYGPDLPDLSSVQSVDSLPNVVELRAQGVVGQSPESDAAYLAAVKSGNAFQRVFYGNTSSALLQFYYDKQASGFVKSDPLTMFCRHVVFDLNSMSIISVGMPGALSYDAFMTSQGSDGVSIEEFLEGTMLVYNQRLGQFGQQSVTTMESSTSDETSSAPAQPQHDWALSTRRKLGTSFFNNPGKTFDQMFRENNTAAGTEFGDLDYLANKALVFNLEHEENRVVNPITNNRNTLVAAYQLPEDFNTVRTSVQGVLNAVFNAGVAQTKSADVSADADDHTQTVPVNNSEMLKHAVMSHAAVAEVKQLHVDQVIGDLVRRGVKGLRSPTRLFVYHGTDPLTVVNSMVANMDKYMAGVILKTAGETRRTKVRNPVHYELLSIKGSGPITISDRNKHNLFKVYWNLRQHGPDAIQQFLDVFDNKSATYKNIFTWYDVLISGMNHQLFQEYHNVFVRKTMQAQAISYAFKPLCGELHKLYKANRQPITRDSVIQFVAKLEHNQIYWRLFGIDA